MPQPAERRGIRPTTTRAHLNDNVLRESFHKMNLFELCTVVDICYKHRRNAPGDFSLRLKDMDLVVYDGNGRKNTFNIRHLSNILREFGPSINSIDVSLRSMYRNNSARVLRVMTKCCGESLNELELKSFDFNADVIRDMQPMLSRLQVIKLSYCTFASTAVASRMFSFCSELQTLSIMRTSRFDASRAFPKLKSICLHNDLRNLVTPIEPIKQFLRLNQQLREIDINLCDLSSEVMHSIAKYTPQIEKIALRSYSRDFIEYKKYLKQLTALTSLQINFGGELQSSVLTELAAVHIPLECLRLNFFQSDRELVEGITKLKQLKILELTHCVEMESSHILTIVSELCELTELVVAIPSLLVDDLVGIVRRAPKLNKLVFHNASYCEPIFGVYWFMEIKDLLRKRTEKCRLDLSMSCVKVDVPEVLLKANADIFKIDTV